MQGYTPPPCPQSTKGAKHDEVGRERKEGEKKEGRKKERGKKEGRQWKEERRKRKEESYHHLLYSSGIVQGTPALEDVHQKLVLCQFYCVYGCDYQWAASLETFQEGRGESGALGEGREGGGI